MAATRTRSRGGGGIRPCDRGGWNSLKSNDEGGAELAREFFGWCEQQIARYVEVPIWEIPAGQRVLTKKS